LTIRTHSNKLIFASILLFVPLLSFAQWPCTAISEEYLKEYFNVTDQKVSKKTVFSPYEICSYKWTSKVKQYRTSGSIELLVDLDNQLSITLVKLTGDDPQKSFQESVLAMNTTNTPVTALDGEAVWFPEKNQLSVLYKNYLVHVSLEYYDDAIGNKHHSVVIAQKVLENIN